jgi:hypothetical protein
LDTITIHVIEDVARDRTLELEPDIGCSDRATRRDGHCLRIVASR